MLKKDWHKFPVLFNLYIAQSIPMSFFSTVVPVIMRQENYSLESIGLFQLVKLPWIIKFLWAPLIDNTARTDKKLRQWIIFSEIFYALVILSVSLFDLDTQFKTIIIFIIVALVASATQDIATDAFAIMVLKKKERSLGNSVQSAGSFVGSLFGTGVLLIAYDYLGWHALLALLAVFVLISIVPLMFYKRKQKEVEPVKRAGFLDIFRFFGQKNMGHRIFVLLFYYSGLIGILAMIKPFLVDLGYSAKEIGVMSGIFGTSVAACCAFLSGFIIRKIGRRKSLFLFLMISFLAGVYFWSLTQTSPALWQLYLGIALVWAAYGLSSVVIYTTSMDVVRKGREGTDFTIQIVLTHLSGIFVAIACGRLGDRLGYEGIFAAEASLSLLVFVILIFALKGVKYDEN